MHNDRRAALLRSTVDALCAERGAEPPATTQADELWTVLRALVNTRPPAPAAPSLLATQDELLRAMIEEAGVSTVADALASPQDSRLLLWRGDITTLAVDAVVNAANSRLLGCWVPGHLCIDNAIHTFAGIELRIECARMMQGREEHTGAARMTPAYNLPSRHVIHTVGPVAAGHPTEEHRRQLASCYTSCLDVAAEHGLRTVAVCSISTGVFGYPRQEAAETAVETVRGWLSAHDADLRVIFNVFSQEDESTYRPLLGL